MRRLVWTTYYYEGCPISNLVRYEEIHLEIGNFAYVLSDISVLDVQHFDIFRYIVFQQCCTNLYNPFSKKIKQYSFALFLCFWVCYRIHP